MERILIVDDEPELLDTLRQAFSELGYSCLTADNGETATKLAWEADLVILDIMMPKMNGFTAVRELRDAGYRRPIIFLTAKDGTADLVRGLDSGADDYVVKPFRLEELFARVRSASRRQKEVADVIEWEGIRLDARSRTVHRGTWEVFLSATEFDLLSLFLRNPGAILSKPRILEEVWKDDGFRDENIVETYITYLRRKLEVKGLPRVIHTIRGRGYVLSLIGE
jgi:DNA-binding response OmpR family regulator